MAKLKIPFGEILIEPYAWEHDNPKEGWLLTKIRYSADTNGVSINLYREAQPVQVTYLEKTFQDLKNYLAKYSRKDLGRLSLYETKELLFISENIEYLIELDYVDFDADAFSFAFYGNPELIYKTGSDDHLIGGKYTVEIKEFVRFFEELEKEVQILKSGRFSLPRS